MGNYVTVDDIRDEGITEEQATEEVITEVITASELDFERWCNRWFYRRTSYTYTIDGGESYAIGPYSGGFREELNIPVPIISIASITIDGIAKDMNNFIVRNRIGAPVDDRNDPKIISKLGEWPEYGLNNIVLVGDFGYVNDTTTYSTPTEVKRAVRKLVIRNLPFLLKMTDTDRYLFFNQHLIFEEQTAGYRYRMRRPNVNPNETEVKGFTGDQEIDDIIEKYRYKLFAASV
jgi:hypothetical protein